MRTAASLQRELLLGVALTAFVFVCALAWGSPFVAVPSHGTPVQAQSQAQAASFTGTIERNGEQFVLRETSGQIYRLDDPKDAQAFEGKAVTVIGKLDSGAHMIHVEQIRPATA
jgi:hypothetical protein